MDPKCARPPRLAGQQFANLQVDEYACPPELLSAPRYVEANMGELIANHYHGGEISEWQPPTKSVANFWGFYTRGGVESNEFRIDFHKIFRIIFHLQINRISNFRIESNEF